MSLRLTDVFDGEPGGDVALRGRLIRGDNRAAMEALLPELGGRIDLIYLDPPFDVGQDFASEVDLGNAGARVRAPAYRDRWGAGEDSYLQMLYERLALARELLAETGSLIVHVNWRAAHLVRLLLDELFGPGERRAAGAPGFRNEIVWGYGGGGAIRNAYRRKHDNLLWYTRSDRWTFNAQYRPYTAKTRQRGLTAVKGPRYCLRDEGASLESWWTGPEVQKILSPTARENLKFPTQKPEALLERILLGHSNPGQLVADFFCGSGTTGAVSARLGRRWIMADNSRRAISVTLKRLSRHCSGFDVYEVVEGAPDAGAADDAEAVSVASVRRPAGGWDIRLTGYRPSLPDGEIPAEIRRRAETAPFEFIDYWAVDFDYQAPVFRHEWRAWRSPRGGGLPLESAAGCPLRRPRTAAVKVVDVLGRVTTALLRLG